MTMKKNNKNIKWWIGTISCTTLFGVIVIFAYAKMNFLIHGVQISASINKTNSSPVAIITGKAPNATYLSLNGREIFVDTDGSFAEKVVLLPGLGVITLTAQDKFGKTADKEFQIVYQQNNQVALVSN